jgi:putative membrane protein
MMIQSKKSEKLIQILSIAVPIIVALVLGIRNKIELGNWTKQLTHFIGFINGLTAFLLVLGYVFIKSNNIIWHKRMMLSAFSLGSIFLVLYILYHISNENTTSAGMAKMERWLYLFLLITHILCSVVVVRYVLLAIYYALSNQIEKHKKIVKITFPLWLYVSTTGVAVYLMISPYYKY